MELLGHVARESSILLIILDFLLLFFDIFFFFDNLDCRRPWSVSEKSLVNRRKSSLKLALFSLILPNGTEAPQYYKDAKEKYAKRWQDSNAIP